MRRLVQHEAKVGQARSESSKYNSTTSICSTRREVLFINDFFLAGGAVGQRPVDQAIQLGDGGWGLITQAHLYRAIFRRTTAFGSVWYLISPREVTNVASLLPGIKLAVPDIYAVRLGTAYDVAPKRGVSVNFGARVDGIPTHDLFGGTQLNAGDHNGHHNYVPIQGRGRYLHRAAHHS